VANFWFSVAAGIGSLAVAIGAALRGAAVVAVVFGMLTVGFAARASERRWRSRR
jgi:hypothetical protein